MTNEPLFSKFTAPLVLALSIGLGLALWTENFAAGGFAVSAFLGLNFLLFRLEQTIRDVDIIKPRNHAHSTKERIMDQSTTFQRTTSDGSHRAVAPEFASWPTDGATLEAINEIRSQFNSLLTVITNRVPSGNERYLALTRTKLEEACMFAVKAIAKRD